MKREPKKNLHSEQNKGNSKIKATKKSETENLDETYSFFFKNPVFSRIPVIRGIIKWYFDQGIWHASILLSIILLFLVWGMHDLGKHFTSDEVQFLQELIPNYFNAWRNWNLVQTNVFGKPAILSIVLAGISNLFVDIEKFTPANFDEYLFYWRLPILIFNTITLVIIYNLSIKLSNNYYALIMVGFTAFTPVILGMSQIVNADSLLWNTSYISLLALLLYLKFLNKRYIVYSGIFLALGLASKYNAQILYIIYFMIIYFDYLFRKTTREFFLKHSLALLGIILVASFTFCLFMPAMFFSFTTFYTYTFHEAGTNKAFLLLLGLTYFEVIILKGYISKWIITEINLLKVYVYFQSAALLVMFSLLGFCYIFFNTPLSILTKPVIYSSPDSFWPAIFQNFNLIVTATNIPTILGIFAALILLIIRNYRNKLETIDKYVLYFFTIIILNNIAASLVGFTTNDRYGIMMYPLYYFVLAYSVNLLFKKIKIVTILLLIISLFDFFVFTKGAFFFYSNSVYFKEAGLNRKYFWGYGGYEIAQKANDLPNALNLKILSDYQGFSQFFIGQNQWMTKKITADYIKQFDYLCLRSDGFSQKVDWQLMSYSLLQYYKEPIEKSIFYLGNKADGWVKLVKVDKNKIEPIVPNGFDPDYYFDFNKAFSVAFWVNFTNSNPGNPIFIGFDKLQGISIQSDTQKDSCSFTVKYNNSNEILTTSPLNNGKWYNLCLIHRPNIEKNELSVYIDGQFNGKIKTKIKDSEQKLFLAQYFKGNIQDVRVYNFKLTENQIGRIYNNGNIILEDKINDGNADFYTIQHYVKK